MHKFVWRLKDSSPISILLIDRLVTCHEELPSLASLEEKAGRNLRTSQYFQLPLILYVIRWRKREV